MQKFPSNCHNYFRTDEEISKGLLLRGLKIVHGAGEMAQLRALSEDLGLVPRTHIATHNDL